MRALLNDFIFQLDNHVPFKFSRWGDGEWGCMFGWLGENRDGNKYMPSLREALVRVIKSEPTYYIGIQPGVMVDVGRGYVPEMRKYVLDTLFTLDLDIVIGDILHYASEFGQLGPFIDALRQRNTVIIGAEYFKDTPFDHIVTMTSNSFVMHDEIIKKAKEYDKEDPVFLIAAAMHTNIIVDDLPPSVTAIDIGSVLDPYLGRPRATYQHSMKINPLW